MNGTLAGAEHGEAARQLVRSGSAVFPDAGQVADGNQPADATTSIRPSFPDPPDAPGLSRPQRIR